MTRRAFVVSIALPCVVGAACGAPASNSDRAALGADASTDVSTSSDGGGGGSGTGGMPGSDGGPMADGSCPGPGCSRTGGDGGDGNGDGETTEGGAATVQFHVETWAYDDGCNGGSAEPLRRSCKSG